MHSKHWGVGIVSAVLAGVGMAQTVAQGNGCASTPAGAIELARVGQVGGAAAAQGYRVESVRWDAVQRRTWAVIRSCDHAERPTLAMPADLPHAAAGPNGAVGLVAADGLILASSPVAAAPAPVLSVSAQIAQGNTALPVVHAGDVVRLWRADVQAHIELMATAEENGAMGTKVRLRLLTPKDSDGQYAPPKYLAGIVRGPADVEMEQ